MFSPEEVIIYLDVFVFISLIAFFAILFGSSRLFSKKNNGEDINFLDHHQMRIEGQPSQVNQPDP